MEYLLKSPLSNDLKNGLHYFDASTLDAIILNVLGLVFNPLQELSVIRASTLVELLHNYVQIHTYRLFNRAGLRNSKISHSQPSNEDRLKEEGEGKELFCSTLSSDFTAPESAVAV